MLGFLAGGAAALATGPAQALSASRATCRQFRLGLYDHDGIVRARVLRSWDQRDGGVNCSARVEARVTGTITGPVRQGRTLSFIAGLHTCETEEQAYVPREGADVVLFLTRRPETEAGWVVGGVMSSARYNGWAAKGCAI